MILPACARKIISNNLYKFWIQQDYVTNYIAGITKILNLSLINIVLYHLSEIGVGLAGFGISFLLLGVLLLFDKGLLAIGNVRILKDPYFSELLYIILDLF